VNRSTVTRKAVFFGYTYRWVRSRDLPPDPGSRFTPVQQQLLDMLGDDDGDHAWGHEPERVPLYPLLTSSGVTPSWPIPPAI
jgi:ectoine hydroxylase